MSKRILISYNGGETFLFGYSNDDGKTFVESYPLYELKVGDRFKMKRFSNIYIS